MIEEKINRGKVVLGKTGIYIYAVTNKEKHICLSIIDKPDLRTVGINNITEDEEFVLFLDYDNITFEDLLSQVKYIFDGLNGIIKPISHCFILKTSEDSYHLISLEKFPLSELKMIMENTLCDYVYRKISTKIDKGFILRIKEKVDLDGNIVKNKPEFINFFTNKNQLEPLRKFSRPHVELFSLLYPELSKIYQHYKLFFDDNEIVKLLSYGTYSKSKDFFVELTGKSFIDSKRINIKWYTNARR
ncbi:MAG: hypothetical protein QXG39_04130 [Candidatus Aenigmatarchaeota archaeon]